VASRIKGITVEIGGDTTKLDQAVYAGAKTAAARILNRT
jgi:hypothetical protein